MPRRDVGVGKPRTSTTPERDAAACDHGQHRGGLLAQPRGRGPQGDEPEDEDRRAPSKAPLRYRNVSVVNSEGKQVKSVDLDPERAPLIEWAFREFARGKWTLRQMGAELELRGPTNTPTPEYPTRPVKLSHLYHLLTHPYDKGTVVWKACPVRDGIPGCWIR